jgi:voltage-gated potassium channel Kch
LLDKMAYRIFSTAHSSAASLPDVDGSRTVQQASPVILAGFGRMGHRIGHIMESLRVPYVAIDIDASLVARERGAGRAVYFGDAQRPEVLRAAGAAAAPLVIVSIDSLEAAENVVSSLHSAFPDIPVFARGHDLAKCRSLGVLGADFTVSETLEASAELARAALLHMGMEGSAVAVALENFRKDYYGRSSRDSLAG